MVKAMQDGIKGENFFDVYWWLIYVYVFYMINLLSSPYLFVFGDDRVRSTHE